MQALSMRPRLTTLLPLVALALFIAGGSGCASSGKATKSSSMTVPQTFVLSQPVPERLRYHEPVFVDVLERHGFRMGATGKSSSLNLLLEFNPNVFAMRVTATLRNGDQVIATGTAVNAGVGTVMNPSLAITDLVNKSASELHSQLTSLSGRLRIEADPRTAGSASATAGAPDVYSELTKLDELRRRGILTDSEFETQKRKVLSGAPADHTALGVDDVCTQTSRVDQLECAGKIKLGMSRDEVLSVLGAPTSQNPDQNTLEFEDRILAFDSKQRLVTISEAPKQ